MTTPWETIHRLSPIEFHHFGYTKSLYRIVCAESPSSLAPVLVIGQDVIPGKIPEYVVLGDPTCPAHSCHPERPHRKTYSRTTGYPRTRNPIASTGAGALRVFAAFGAGKPRKDPTPFRVPQLHGASSMASHGLHPLYSGRYNTPGLT